VNTKNEQISHSNVDVVIRERKETHTLVVVAIADVVPNDADKYSSYQESETVPEESG
jgi:hypothetical protein